MMKDKIKTQTKIFIYVDKVLKTKSKNGVLYKSKYKIYRNVVFYSGKHIWKKIKRKDHKFNKSMKKKKVLVDMSVTLLHHGHIEILKKASKFGDVYVALTKDNAILNKKGYLPELNYNQRSKILKSIKYVKDTIPSKWDIDDKFIKKHKIDILVHGDDEFNSARNVKKKIFKRTPKISSNKLRQKVCENYLKIYEKK